MEKEKLVLVTAGSRGIGAAIVKELIKEKYKVIFTYHTNKELAETLSNSLNKEGDVCCCYPCDVRNANEIQKLCETILEEHGTPYGIINNAGISKDNLHINISIDEWHDVINTNLNSTFYFNHYLLKPMMVAGDGCIININSILGFRGNIGQTSYSTSKAAQVGLTKSLAKEVGLFNLRVNCIAPGSIETDMFTSLPKQKKDLLLKSIPLRKFGEPDNIAMMVAFLLGKGGRYITGQIFVIDGGLSI